MWTAREFTAASTALSAPRSLVLSNSLGADLSMWNDQVDALAARFRVVRYDTRGHGSSAATPGPYDVERLGRDVVGLLDGLGIEQAHFCGLSLGGLTGMWLGVHASRRVRRLVLANTAARIGPPENWNARIDKSPGRRHGCHFAGRRRALVHRTVSRRRTRNAPWRCGR